MGLYVSNQLFLIIPTVSCNVYFEGERYKTGRNAKQALIQEKGHRTFKEKFKVWMFYEN